MKTYSFLKESVGEYEDIDSMMASWLGSLRIWWHNVKLGFKGFSSLKELPKESTMVRNVLRGLNISVFAFPEADRNAFVIPGYYIGCEKDYKEIQGEYFEKYRNHSYYGLGGDFMTMLLSRQLKQLLLMRNYKVTNDPKNKGKKIAIFKKVSTPISVFVTYGMLNDATPEQRVGIYLHEVGHWIDSAKSIPKMIIERPETESCYLYYTNVLKRFVTRYEELEADRFAKTLGYGLELASALDQIVSVRKQVSWIYWLGDHMLKSAVRAHDEMEEEGLIGPDQYPSMLTRKRYLKDNK